MDLILVRRAGVRLDWPEVQVAVLPEQLLQLQPVLDLLPEDLQHPGTGGRPGPHISGEKISKKKQGKNICVTHLPVRARGARFLGSSDNGERLEAGEFGGK